MIKIDDLADAITEAVRDYTEDVSAAVAKKVDEVASEVRDDIELNAPKRTGEYAKSFVVSRRDRPGQTRRVIWSKEHYRRARLLEFGHAKRGGGRVAGRPHIRPAYDKRANKLVSDIKQIIRDGG